MSDGRATAAGAGGETDGGDAAGSAGEVSVGRVVVAIFVGSVLTAALAWGVLELGSVAFQTTVGVGLGAAVGGGLGALGYLLWTADESPEADVETVAVSMDESGPDDDRTVEPPTADDLFEAHLDPTLYFADEGAGDGPDLRVLTANGAFEETFGASERTLVDTPLDEVTMTDDLPDLADRVAAGESVDALVTCETVADEGQFRVRAIPLSEDPIQGYLTYTEQPAGYVADTGDNRVEELASVVSHELRNPIDSARARIEAARDTGDGEHFEVALRNLDRLSRIIDDLTTLAREGKLVEEPEVVDLGSVVEAAWKTVDASDATLEREGSLGTVHADGSALEHLFENLFRNAVEHSGDGVTVTVGPLDDGFFVADDGPGIPEDRREDVFDAGFTTDRDGTGLGLRIVEQVAESHGWSVAVTDRDGGACFEFTGVDRPE